MILFQGLKDKQNVKRIKFNASLKIFRGVKIIPVKDQMID
jgi:hypothetical protein